MALTPQGDFREPIILVLGAVGGAAPKPEVLADVERVMSGRLTAEDYEPVATRSEENWRNRASWERNAMKEDGLLRGDTPRVWTLTDAGLSEYRRLIAASGGPLPTPVDPLAGFKPKDASDYRARLSGRLLIKTRTHEALIDEYGRWVVGRGFVPTTPHPCDMILRDGAEEWLVEAKVLYAGNATDAVRAAVGQLLSYSFFLFSTRSPRLAALFSEPIGDGYVSFLTSLDIAAVWMQDGAFVGSATAMAHGLVD